VTVVAFAVKMGMRKTSGGYLTEERGGGGLRSVGRDGGGRRGVGVGGAEEEDASEGEEGEK
jgi:hypothetical protein